MELAIERPGPFRFKGCVDSIIDFSGVEPSHARERLLPAGAIQLVVDLTARPKLLFDSSEGTGGTTFAKAWIAGVQQRPLIIEAQRQAAMVVIRFAPGGAYPVLGLPAEALGGEVVPLEAVLGRAALALRDRLLGADGHAARMQVVAAWLAERLRRRDGPHPAVVYLAHRLRHPDGTSLAALAEESGLSGRQVANLFHRYVGIAPKRYQRLRRFQSLLGSLGGDGEPDWADLAAFHAYADQTHLGHEFRQFSGLTPGQYWSRYRGLGDFLPIGVQ